MHPADDHINFPMVITVTTTPAFSASKSMLYTLTSLLLLLFIIVEIYSSSKFKTVIPRLSKAGCHVLSGIASFTLPVAAAVLTTDYTDFEELTGTLRRKKTETNPTKAMLQRLSLSPGGGDEHWIW